MFKEILVGDEEIVLIGLQTLVNWQEYGFTIVGTAGNGYDALELVQKMKPDVIITDLVMPGMNGLELIENLKQNHFAGEIIVISNYNELNYVKKAMKLGAEDYFLKISCRKEDMISLLGRLKEKLEERKLPHPGESEAAQYRESGAYIQDYLLGQELRAPLESVGESSYQLVYVCISKKPEVTKTDCEKVKRMLKQIFRNERETACFSVDDTTVCLVWNSFDLNKVIENNIFLKLQKQLKLFLMCSCFILYQTNIPSLSNLKDAFERCKTVKQLSFYGERCCRLEGLRLESVDAIITQPDIVRKYKAFLEDANYEELNRQIWAVIQNFKDKNVMPAQTIDFAFSVLLVIQMYVYEQRHVEVLEGYYGKIKRCTNYEDLLTILDEMLNWLKNDTLGSTANQKRDLLDRIKGYVSDHIGERVSVSDIAEEFSFHPNYISTFFKEKTGMTIVQFINQEKIKRAKNLLRSNQYPVKDVARMVGFEDPFYFNRVFKKETGMSPGKFMKEKG